MFVFPVRVLVFKVDPPGVLPEGEAACQATADERSM
jgi:hypothetical protein